MSPKSPCAAVVKKTARRRDEDTRHPQRIKSINVHEIFKHIQSEMRMTEYTDTALMEE